MGGANYSSIMPYNSYIDVKNFSSPENLANFIKEIGNDKNKYNSYFDWKHEYCSFYTHPKYLCDLCKKLNIKSHINRSDVMKFWFQEANCQS